MNWYLKNILLLLLLLIFNISIAETPQGYDIKIKVKGFKQGSTVVLGNYYADKNYIQDSAKVDANGVVEFKGKEKLPQGLYIIIPENKNYFDLIMDETQHYTVETDTSNYVEHMKIKGSLENDLFYSYQKFISKQYKNIEPYRSALKHTQNKDSIEQLKQKMKHIDEEVKDYKKNFIDKNTGSFVVKFLKAMDDPIVPPAPELPNGKKDSLFSYYYYKTHFLDNIDFSDDRILRTPILYKKVKQYMEQLTPQMPDSIAISADYLVEKARNNPEIFKWLVYWLTYTYESSSIMGMEAVFVHMVDKYYATHQAYWVDSAQLVKIVNRAWELKPNLIGKKAQAISMIDSTGKQVNLYDIKASYTIVVFWDQDCGHCKKEIPVLYEIYRDTLKAKGVQVYAIAAENKEKEWKKFIQEHKLNWMNVHQPDDYKRAVTKKLYDIQSTPYIYLLDEAKIIRAKRIAPEQLVGFIDALEKEKKGKH